MVADRGPLGAATGGASIDDDGGRRYEHVVDPLYRRVCGAGVGAAGVDEADRGEGADERRLVTGVEVAGDDGVGRCLRAIRSVSRRAWASRSTGSPVARWVSNTRSASRSRRTVVAMATRRRWLRRFCPVRQRGAPRLVERPRRQDRQSFGAPPHQRRVRVVLEDPLDVPAERRRHPPRLPATHLLDRGDVGVGAVEDVGDEPKIGLRRPVQVPGHHSPRAGEPSGGGRHHRSLATARYVAPPWIVWRARWH